MSKVSAIGSKAYFGGYDLSGDITALGAIDSTVNLLDVSAIESAAMERIMLRRDGKMSFNAIFNPSVGRSHPVLSAFPTTDLHAMWAAGVAAGDIAAMLMAKQANYSPVIGADGSMLLSAEALGSAGFCLEWGQSVTAGKRTDTAATATGTGIDLGIPSPGTAVAVTGASAANPTVVTAPTHGLVSGDSVLFAGASQGALNDGFTVTVVNANTFTVPLDLSGGASTGGTFQKTSSNTGWAAQLQSFAFTGTSSTVTVQHAPKNDASAFVSLTGGGFTAVTAVGSQRINGAATAIIQRFVRVITTGTFSEHTYAVGVARL